MAYSKNMQLDLSFDWVKILPKLVQNINIRRGDLSAFFFLKKKLELAPTGVAAQKNPERAKKPIGTWDRDIKAPGIPAHSLSLQLCSSRFKPV